MPARDEKSADRPTMRQIAALAGVSAMTVSRALRDNPRITEAVRAKIHRIAREIGYRPDPEVVKLMSHLRRRGKPTFVTSIAALTSLRADIEPPFLRRAREAAQARANELGHAFEVFHIETPEHPDRRLQRMLLARGIEGVLLLQMHAPLSVESLLDWEKFSAVVATPSVLAPEFPRVLAHHFHNALLLCEELGRRGHGRIGFVGPESFCVRTRHAFSAASVWHGMSGSGAAVPPFIFAGSQPDRAALVRWFERERPDALIAHAEEPLLGIARQLGIDSGGPVALACTNVDPLAPKWPGIDERHDLIGVKAVDVLTGLLNRNEKNLRVGHASTLIEGRWVEPPVTRRA